MVDIFSYSMWWDEIFFKIDVIKYVIIGII